jgi:hypothetical protein
MQRAPHAPSPADQAFQRMVRLAARDPVVRALFAALVQASRLPRADRVAMLRHFLSAGAEPHREN